MTASHYSLDLLQRDHLQSVIMPILTTLKALLQELLTIVEKDKISDVDTKRAKFAIEAIAKANLGLAKIERVKPTGGGPSVEIRLKYGIAYQISLDHCRDKYDRTPLGWACFNGHMEIAKFLVEQKADPNCFDSTNVSPIRIAIRQNHAALVQSLLEQKANPNLANDQGETPLMLAWKNDNIELVQSLLKHNADPTPMLKWVERFSCGLAKKTI